MLGHYLRLFIRNSINRKVYTLITVLGLALGLAVATVLGLYVNAELSFDKQWRDADRIYQVIGITEAAGNQVAKASAISYYKLASLLEELFPSEVETQVSFMPTSGRIKVGEKSFQTVIIQVDKVLPQVFQIPLIAGDWQQTLADPHNLAIPEIAATAMFGDEPALGKIVVWETRDGQSNYTVTAVFGTVKATSATGQLNQLLAVRGESAMADYQDMLDNPGKYKSITINTYSHFVKLRQGVDVNQLENRLRAMMDERGIGGGSFSRKTRFGFQTLPEVHLAPQYSLGNAGNKLQLLVFSLLATLILVIAGANFVVLSTLRVVDKIREAGIRKAAGGFGYQLIAQHLVESFCLSALAAVLALVLAQASMPSLQPLFMGLRNVDILNPQFLWSYPLAVLLFSVLSGLYPALLFSRARPNGLLRQRGIHQGPMRSTLMTLQFVLAIALVSGGVAILLQIDYLKHRDRGFDDENVYMIFSSAIVSNSSFAETMSKNAALVNEMKKLDGVADVVIVTSGPDQGGVLSSNNPGTPLIRDAAEGGPLTTNAQSQTVGAGFFRVFSIPVLAGREFEQSDMPVLAENGSLIMPKVDDALKGARVILNMTAAKQLGFRDPAAAINQLLTQEVVRAGIGNLKGAPAIGATAKIPLVIIGVVADARYRSLLAPPQPEFYSTNILGTVAVKLKKGNSAEQVKEMNAVWERVMGTKPEGYFPAQRPNNALAKEVFEARVVLGCAGITIIIASFSLYALLASALQRRVKEIGIRKALGADTFAIVGLFLRNFTWPLLGAAAIGVPIAAWGISQWLQRFPYRITWIKLAAWGSLALFLTFLLVWMIIASITYFSARRKPVLSLRYE